jgi:hypothetical protein
MQEATEFEETPLANLPTADNTPFDDLLSKLDNNKKL